MSVTNFETYWFIPIPMLKGSNAMKTISTRRAALYCSMLAAFQATPGWANEAAPSLATGKPVLSTSPTQPSAQLPLSVDYASIAPILTAPTQGAAYKMGGVHLYPYLMFGLGRNDNVLGTNTNEKSSSFVELRPALVAEVAKAGDRYTLSYSGDYGHYASSDDDDFDYHDLFVAGDNHFSTRAALGWRVGYTKRSDPRGSNDTAFGSEPNAWHATVANALFGYGAVEAKGRVELEAGLQNKRYDNNEAVTRSFDLDTRNLAGRFLYRVAPKTRALFEVRHVDADYRLASSTQDNTETFYNVGVTWDTTAATTGIFKLGRLKKNFDNAARDDFSGNSWEGTVRWSPRTYSVFDLSTARNTADSTGVGEYLINRNLGLTWNHMWSDRVSTLVSYSNLKTEYAGDPRRDDTDTFSIGANYTMRRWLRLGVNLTHTDRSSNQAVNEYDRNVLMFTVEGTL